jgi:glycosyltransferase 2 family protein
MDTPAQRSGGGGWRRFALGMLLLGGLVLAVVHFGELEHFARLAESAEPAWLIAALAAQVATYGAVATAWHLALDRGGRRMPVRSLLPLGLAKLFSDQALPSGGISGTAFALGALHRRGVSPELAMAVMLTGLVSSYGAALVMDGVCVAILWAAHELHSWMIVIAVLFALLAAALPGGALLAKNWSEERLARWSRSLRGAAPMLRAFAAAPTTLLRNPALVLASALLHGSVFLLDTGTLWLMFQALGHPTGFLHCLAAFMMASMAGTIGLIPLGLGTFETTCVATLAVLGCPLEPALAATLLLRGFTMWLPMLPGMWLVRREAGPAKR